MLKTSRQGHGHGFTPTLKNLVCGFTLIEILIHFAIIVIIIIFITSFALEIIQINFYATTSKEVLDNARTAIEFMSVEIRNATSIYTPTSTFNAHPGQLSLETKQNLPPQEITTYVDFYVDDNRLYMKRETEPFKLITSEKVKVNNLVFTYFNATSTSQAIRIQLSLSYDIPNADETQVTLMSTASLRTN